MTVQTPLLLQTPAYSGNFSVGRQGINPEAFVLHIAQGSFSGIASWFADPQAHVSAHFSVAKDGRIQQHVKITDTAFANGIIEAGYTAQLINDNTVNGVPLNPNNWSVSCEHEGNSGDVVPQVQFNSSTLLCAWIFDTVLLHGGASNVAVDRKHILKHADISPLSRKNCPGWSDLVIADYIARVNQLLFATPPKDFQALWRAELQGVINSANDDILRATIRKQDAQAKLNQS